MAVNGKSKGDAFERKVAKLFNSKLGFLFNSETPFLRNLTSGSYFGGKNKHRATQVELKDLNVGDIITPSNFKFTIECKFYKSPPSFSQVIRGDVKQWETWFGQVISDATTSGKEPLLLIKYNNVPEIAFIPSSLFPFAHSSYDYLAGERYFSMVPLSVLLDYREPDFWLFSTD